MSQGEHYYIKKIEFHTKQLELAKAGDKPKAIKSHELSLKNYNELLEQHNARTGAITNDK